MMFCLLKNVTGIKGVVSRKGFSFMIQIQLSLYLI